MEQQSEQPATNDITNGGIENGHQEAPQKDETSVDEKDTSPARSEGSQEGIQLSKIKIITRRHVDDGEEESGDDDEEEEEEPEEEIKPKKMVKKKKKKKVAKPAEVLTKTLGQAIRLITEKKEKERQKIKQQEIRKMALEQKKRQELAGPSRVLIHM